MSDVGYLSYQHAQATNLAERLEKALDEVQAEHLSVQTRQQLALKLGGLIALLEPLGNEAPHTEEVLRIPIELVELLRASNFHGRPYADALTDLSERLGDRRQSLSAPDIELLEQVVSATEKTVSSTYRQMVRG